MKEDNQFSFLLLCTFRYCLGKKTYHPCYLKEIIKEHIDLINEDTKKIILKELTEYGELGNREQVKAWAEVVGIILKRK